MCVCVGDEYNVSITYDQADAGGWGHAVHDGAAGPGGATVRGRQLYRDRQELGTRLHRCHIQDIIR